MTATYITPEFKRYVYDCVKEEKVCHSYLLSSGIIETKWVDTTSPFDRFNVTIRVHYNDQLMRLRVLINKNDHQIFGSNHVFHETIADLVRDIKQHIYMIHPTKTKIDELQRFIRENVDFNDIIKVEQARENIYLLEIELEKELDNIIMRDVNNEIKDQTPTQTDEEEFEAMDQKLKHASKTFKLNLQSIRRLDKKTSNKFVLPLTDSNEGISKWNELITKPFGFLAYNGAKFSIDLVHRVGSLQDHEEQLRYDNYLQYTNMQDRIEAKRKHYIEKAKKLNKVSKKLIKQIDELKEQFEKKTKKVKQPKLLRFLAERTATNIKTIREAEGLVTGRANALRNKRLITDPVNFFKRSIRLFLGKTGDDVLTDMVELGLTTKADYLLSIDYLYFLMTVLEKRKDHFVPPIIAIADSEEMGRGFKKLKLLKILTGHMFIHTITVTNKPQIDPSDPSNWEDEDEEDEEEFFEGVDSYVDDPTDDWGDEEDDSSFAHF